MTVNLYNLSSSYYLKLVLGIGSNRLTILKTSTVLAFIHVVCMTTIEEKKTILLEEINILPTHPSNFVLMIVHHIIITNILYKHNK